MHEDESRVVWNEYQMINPVCFTILFLFFLFTWLLVYLKHFTVWLINNLNHIFVQHG